MNNWPDKFILRVITYKSTSISIIKNTCKKLIHFITIFFVSISSIYLICYLKFNFTRNTNQLKKYIYFNIGFMLFGLKMKLQRV